jgi:hypothetical protein
MTGSSHISTVVPKLTIRVHGVAKAISRPPALAELAEEDAITGAQGFTYGCASAAKGGDHACISQHGGLA